MLQAKFVEKTKTHILYVVTFFENRIVYDIIVEPDRTQMITWYKRNAC